MRHQTERLSALVDGEADHQTRDRLLAHLTGCPWCRAVVEEERVFKAALARLPAPEPSPRLYEALVGLAEPAAAAAASSTSTRAGLPHWAGSLSARRAGRAVQDRPGAGRTRRDGVRVRPPRRRYTGISGLAALGLVVATALAIGGVSDPPAVSPAPSARQYGPAPGDGGPHSLSGPGAVTASFHLELPVSVGGR